MADKKVRLNLVKSESNVLEVLDTMTSDIHGIARTADTTKSVVIHGPMSTKYLVNTPFETLSASVYGS